MNREANEYVLGTDRAELDRLGLQHQLWLAETASGWERAGFCRGARILDVGSGPGFATIDLAERVGPRGAVVAVDMSQRFLAHLEQLAKTLGLTNIETSLSSVERLAIRQSNFDGAYARWVLCFVRRPGKVLKEVARRLKRGGRFLIQDYYRYESITIAPQSKAFTDVFRAVHNSWIAHGGDPDVGCRLPGLLERAGFEVKQISPIVRGARPGSPLWDWPDSFFDIYLPNLVKGRFITPAQERAFRREWAKRSCDPGAFFTSPPMLEIIAVKK